MSISSIKNQVFFRSTSKKVGDPKGFMGQGALDSSEMKAGVQLEGWESGIQKETQGGVDLGYPNNESLSELHRAIVDG